MSKAAIILRLKGVGYGADALFRVIFDSGQVYTCPGNSNSVIEVSHLGKNRLRVEEGDFSSDWKDMLIEEGFVYNVIVSVPSKTSLWMGSLFGGSSVLDIDIVRE